MATSDWWFAFVPAPGNKITPEITNQLATSFHERKSTQVFTSAVALGALLLDLQLIY